MALILLMSYLSQGYGTWPNYSSCYNACISDTTAGACAALCQKREQSTISYVPLPDTNTYAVIPNIESAYVGM